jgi:hypothetical protein
MVFTESGNNPLKLEDEVDHSRLIAFFGQIGLLTSLQIRMKGLSQTSWNGS